MHVRSSGYAAMTPSEGPAPPDTPEGFARMSYEQRAALHARDVSLYRQLAAQERDANKAAP